MNRFLNKLGKQILVMDGAMGTQLMNGGVGPEDCFDLQNISRPELVKSIHRAYVKAGADIIETNTFGANSIKLIDYHLENKVEEINIKAAQLALEATQEKALVCGSMGPLGQMIDPLGVVTFDQAYLSYAQQAKALEKGGVDVVSIETISDLQEMRAAVIAVKNETKLPIIASLTYDQNEKTIYGTSPEVAVTVLESIGANVIAANCSTGPEGMLSVVKKLKKVANVPIMVMPNAGMPELVGNKAVYKMTPKQFGRFALEFAKLGVLIIGGCCGTTPEHIQQIKKEVKNYKLKSAQKVEKTYSMFSSRTRIVNPADCSPMLVGERINPTGRKKFQQELLSNRTQTIKIESVDQTKAKADLLDVNISAPEINESDAMYSAVKVVQSNTEMPLSIDSPNLNALEAGLKTFCGRALLNSVNGKQESMRQVLPLAKKYGSAVIALTLDDNGIPKSALERCKIAQTIVHQAQTLGIMSGDIYVDNLVMTAGVGIKDCLETLKAIPIVKEKLKVKTILGISNVSHGMPNRAKINALYFKLAVAYGLDAAIIDPTENEMQKAIKVVRSSKKLNRQTLLKQFKNEVNQAVKSGKPAEKKREANSKEIKFTNYKDICDSVISGDAELTSMLVNQALAKNKNPQKIIDSGLVPGMEIVGKKFNRKEYYLPQVIESAEAMKIGFKLCKAEIPSGNKKSSGKVLLATVKGDIHDIGKNIVKMLLENHGFDIIDLGKDVSAEKIILSAKKEQPNVIALSALLTTTMIEMGVVREELKRAKLEIPLLVGGAVVTKSYASKIGANYGQDAVGAVELVRKIIKTTQA